MWELTCYVNDSIERPPELAWSHDAATQRATELYAELERMYGRSCGDWEVAVAFCELVAVGGDE